MLTAVAHDPLKYQVDLPFEATWYPMGYPVELESNSRDALRVAADLWRRYPCLSETAPVRLRIIAGSASPVSPCEASPPRGQDHLLSIVHGPQDFAMADLSRGFAFACLSPSSLSDPEYFRYYFLEPLVYVMLAARHFVFAHASCISRDGRAILLSGDSGSGKTCLAFACAQRGWDFVSGDAVHIVRGREDRLVIGRPYEIRFRESARLLFPELWRFRPQLRASGKIDLEFDPAELNIRTALQSHARHIVFLERSNSLSSPHLDNVSREDAMERLEEAICFGDDHTRSQQRLALAHFAELPLWRLRYSDPDQAERILRSL